MGREGTLVLDLWLVRHGETDGNAQRRIHGRTDTPLNATGVAQAERLASRLAGVAFDAVFASPLRRAHGTATVALPGSDPRLDPRLRELDYGIFEGRTWEELDEAEAAIARWWREDTVNRRLPEGESYAEMAARLLAFRAELPASGTVAVFTHGGCIRNLLYTVLEQPQGNGLRIAVEIASITRLRFDARGATILTVNDHAHLDGPA